MSPCRKKRFLWLILACMGLLRKFGFYNKCWGEGNILSCPILKKSGHRQHPLLQLNRQNLNEREKMVSTFDYIANSLNVKGNVIKKCIHSEQQIEFIMELNELLSNALIVMRRPIESRITVGKGLLSIHFAPTGFCPIT